MPSTPRQQVTSKKRANRELFMLSCGSNADRDKRTRLAAKAAGAMEHLDDSDSDESSGHISLSDGESSDTNQNSDVQVVANATITPVASLSDNDDDDTDGDDPINNGNRTNLLNIPGGGDIAADVGGDAVPFLSPPRPVGNGKTSFKAIDPVNVLYPKEVLELTFQNVMVCPNPFCATKVPTDDNYNTKTLETKSTQYGFASEMEITCKCCNWQHLLCPLVAQEKGDTPNSTPSKKRKAQDRDTEKFHMYEINYSMGLCMQFLGKGFTHLAMMLAHLGILNSIGSKFKWKIMMDKIGLAAHELAEVVMEDNRKVERDLTEAKADEDLLSWLQSEEGKDANEETTSTKRDELLRKKDGKIGIVMSGDNGWTKRTIGKSGGNSRTGQNYGVGGYSKKIISAQSCSKGCRICYLAEKLGKEKKDHRCPRNFDINKSSKSMEGYSNVQHLVDIFESKHSMYVCGFVCDDDSSTRANQKHSYLEIMKVEHPEAVEVDENGNESISAANKRRFGWPLVDIPDDWIPAGNGRYFKPKQDGGYHKKATLPGLKVDHGLLPLHVPEPFENYADINHRGRVFGNRIYELRANNAKTKSNKGLDGGECENAKRNFTYFLAKNQHYSDERFCKEAMCVVLHMWDYHYLCDIEWCTALQAEKEESPRKRRKLDNRKKYRSDKTPSGMKLKEKTINKVKDLIVGPRMLEVHHGYNTQKNETLNKQQSQYCPKDQDYGGSMQFHDRCRLLVIMDSLGHYEGLSRLYHQLGLPPLTKPLALWAATKDKEDEYQYEYTHKVEVKKSRAAAKVKKMKESMKKDMRAEQEGVTYGSGIATTATSNDSSLESDKTC